MSAKVTRKWLRLRLLVGVLVVLGALLFAGYEVVIHNVQPDAVRIRHSDVTGHVLAERTITDPRTVADDYAGINSMTAIGLNTVHCDLGPRSAYTVTFTRGSLIIEVATLSDTACPSWLVVRGGIPNFYIDSTNATLSILAQVQP